jgi:hypothetical protein
MKFFPIVDPSLRDDFLTQLKLHWSHAKVGHEEMTQQKKVNVAIARVDPQEKVEWLHIWNGDQVIKNYTCFPPNPISGPTLDLWLNRKTFWW